MKRSGILNWKGIWSPTHDMIKNPEQIAGIRESGRINTLVLDYVAEHIREGDDHGGD